MHLRPSSGTIDGRSAIELWDGDRHAATIYAQRAGLHIVCEDGYTPALATEPQKPLGVLIAISHD